MVLCFPEVIHPNIVHAVWVVLSYACEAYRTRRLSPDACCTYGLASRIITTVILLDVNTMARAPGFSMQIGGMALHEGNIAEMKTGEGKTLVATLPTYLNALTGRGVHVITVNDYLADRDSHWYLCHLCQIPWCCCMYMLLHVHVAAVQTHLSHCL